ncbi:STAS-like domain-containing protein [Alcaligenes aquatilis]|uniref:STAS-like domain-containing protein n=1 Tax=Alcaligenes aquatilis TaxID=323284 RepID=UPI003F90DE14
MSTRMIHVAKEFSPSPAARYIHEGPNSGERFRRDFLAPALRNSRGGRVVVNLEGVVGMGSSFLEEAFGGLVRAEHFSFKELQSRLEVLTVTNTHQQRIWRYIKDADQRKK